jgi:protein TonB
VVSPPKPEPPPEPPKPEPPKPPPPKPLQQPVHEAPRLKPPVVQEVAQPPAELPPASAPATGAPGARPRFGVTMESTSQGGKVPVPIGNTTAPTAPETAAREPGRALPPAAAHEVTKMPLPQGRCTGKHTEAALAAGIEGVVVLDVIVDEQGRARDIEVVSGLTHGLTEAAIAALRACRFTPGEKDGVPVPVRVRGFKIRFLMQEGR